jgi:hypothetical protein
MDSRPQEVHALYYARRAFIHLAQVVLEAALITALIFALLAGTVFAAKGGRAAGGTSNFHVDDGTYGTTTTAYRGSTSATWVHAKCSQNGRVVYEQYVSYDGGSTATLMLGPTPSWSGGSATCVGEEGWWRNGTRWRVISTDAFAAAG